MSVTYTNRKGKTYHLHQGVTKKGNPKYHFSLKQPQQPVAAIPKGYEIYENPNAQVYLRKIRPKLITDEELAVVQQGVKAHANVKHFLLDIKKDAIIIFTAEEQGDPFLDQLSSLFAAPQQQVEALLTQHQNYMAMMRFVLADKQQRTFVAERYCFLGAIDDWIQISAPTSLKKLVVEFTPHLGQESFYELH